MKILVYDDCPAELNLLKKILQGTFQTVIGVTNLKDFHDKVTNEDFDLYLIDQNLELNQYGVDIAKKYIGDIKAPFVLITSQKETHLLENAFESGFSDFITKPYNINILKRKLKLCIENYNAREKKEELYSIMNKQMEVAQGLLGQLMPSRLKLMNDMHLNWYSYSCNTLGGDFVFHESVDKNTEVFVLGDISGHDVRSALLISAFYTSFRDAIINSGSNICNILNDLNSSLSSSVLKTDFICLLLGVYNTSENTVSFANLGMRAPIHFSNTEKAHSKIKASGDLPLGWKQGVYGDDMVQTIQMSPGDLFVSYTDGFYEKTASNDMLNYRDIQSSVNSLVEQSKAFSLSQELMKSFKIGEDDYHDDATILTLGRLNDDSHFHLKSTLEMSTLTDISLSLSKKVFELTLSQNISSKVELILSETLSNMIKHNEIKDNKLELYLDLTKDLNIYISRKKSENNFKINKGSYSLPESFSTGGYGLYLIRSLTSKIEEYISGDNYVTCITL
jgi:serine phosphatase RsbU (regulator of sigma subunit)/anti-sigma regulatory factor (Ser/Thr protein kinase)